MPFPTVLHERGVCESETRFIETQGAFTMANDRRRAVKLFTNGRFSRPLADSSAAPLE